MQFSQHSALKTWVQRLLGDDNHTMAAAVRRKLLLQVQNDDLKLGDPPEVEVESKRLTKSVSFKEAPGEVDTDSVLKVPNDLVQL